MSHVGSSDRFLALRTIATELEKERARLRADLEECENELEELGNSIADQQLFIVSGYLVSVRREDDQFVAHCPTLRAVANGASVDEAVQSLREAMQTSLQGHGNFGLPVPAKDTETRCLD